MYTIATLHDLRRHLNLEVTESVTDDDLLRNLEDASHLIESLTERRYCPRIETIQVSLDPENPRELILPDDLLELHAIADEGGEIDLADIRALPNDGDAPASILQLVNGAAFRFSSSPIDALAVSGIWGWHDRWSRAWRDSGDTVLDDTLAAGASVINVGDVTAEDQDGFSPRFHVGHLLRIESEYLRVTAIDSDNDRLTVLRGVAGSEAVLHDRGAEIETYAPAPAIRDLTLRYADLLSKSVGLLTSEASPLLERLRRLTV